MTLLRDGCEQFFDLTITAKNGKSTVGDRLVLASRIPNLKDLLCEVSPGSKISWPCFTFENIDAWISYSFTGKLEITKANALELYLMAVILKDVPNQTQCWKILKKRLSIETFGKLTMLASYSEEKSFAQDCLWFLEKKLTAHPNLRNKVLASLEVNAVRLLLNEEPNLDAKIALIVEWMRLVRDRYSDSEFLSSMNTLAGSIDWTFMSPSLLSENLNDFSEELRDAITKKIDEQPHINMVTISDRANIEMVVYVLRMHPFNGMYSSHKLKLPFIHRFGLAETNGVVYMIGGYVGKSTSEVYRLDIVKNKFREVNSMTSVRTNPSCAASKEEIFVCGGCVDDEVMLKSCEVFNLETEKWTALPDMIERRMKCEVVWMPDGMIYAIGGMNNVERSASVEVLPRALTTASSSESPQRWRMLAPMAVSRNFFAAAQIKDQIVVCGGFTGDVGLMANPVEIFSPPKTNQELGQWTTVCEFAFHDPILTACFYDDRLFLLYATGYDVWKLKSQRKGNQGQMGFEFGTFEKFPWNIKVSDEYYVREAIMVDTKRFLTV